MRACLAPLIVLALATPVAAQSTMERLETVAVAMNGMMNEALIAEIPALEGRMPAPEWDAPMRAAYTCMYDAYVAEVGPGPVADMVTRMEQELATLTPEDLLNGGAAVENPEGISDDQALEIVGTCQLMEVFMERMAASGAIEMMMQQQQ